MTVVVRRGLRSGRAKIKSSISLTEEQRARVVQILHDMKRSAGGMMKLARGIGLSRFHLNAVLRGREPPGMIVAVKLAALCGVPVADLLRTDAPPPTPAVSPLVCPTCRAQLVVVAGHS